MKIKNGNVQKMPDTDQTLPQKMRILGYLSAAPRVSTSQEAEASGPRAHVLGVIEAFKSLGWEVHPYIVGNRVPRAWIIQSERKLEGSSLIRFGADIVRLVMGLFHSLEAWREMNGKVDWVYERFAVLQALGWIFQRKGVPWILETSGLFFYEAKIERKSVVLSGIVRIMELWAYRRCDVLVCVTEVLKELIIHTAGIPPEKVLVVPNGVDTARFDPSQHSPKRVWKGPTLGFVGTLVNWHRLDMLLVALAEVMHEGINLNLVVVGDGPMRRIWEAQARGLDLHGCVRFVGRVSWNDVPAYISGFDLGYMGNSPLEIGIMYHSPLKLYEYMAMERPVVASAYADAQQIIVQGQNGYLFEPGSKDDLKRALHLAYQDQARWQEMGKSARERVLEYASWKTRVQTMILGIERILEGQGANSPAGY